MSSRIPDLLSDSPPPELLSDSVHSDAPSTTSSTTKPLHASVRPIPVSSHSHGKSTPTPPPSAPSPSPSPSSSGFLSYPTFSRMASSLTRRLTDHDTPIFGFGGSSSTTDSSLHHSQHHASMHEKRPAPTSSVSDSASLGNSAVFQPPGRTASPFAPPPLTGLSLVGLPTSSRADAQLLSKPLAEEIRLLLPPRLQLSEQWTLAFSVERDGVSLHTLYGKCASLGGSRARGGWVLVLRDGGGGIFGAYLTDAPHPSSNYFGTGECFLWRASVVPASSGLMLKNLPPPPSADTSDYAQRHVTLASPTSPTFGKAGAPAANGATPGSGVASPDLLRFKAFPYSGVNDYLIYCEQDYLSVGGGDGRYGLWLDSNLEKGVSAACMTFGNEPLSEDGEKFEVLGVEIWFVAA